MKVLLAAVQKQVDRAADIVDELMEEINKELFVATAVADITRETTAICCTCKPLRLHNPQRISFTATAGTDSG